MDKRRMLRFDDRQDLVRDDAPLHFALREATAHARGVPVEDIHFYALGISDHPGHNAIYVQLIPGRNARPQQVVLKYVRTPHGPGVASFKPEGELEYADLPNAYHNHHAETLREAFQYMAARRGGMGYAPGICTAEELELLVDLLQHEGSGYQSLAHFHVEAVLPPATTAAIRAAMTRLGGGAVPAVQRYKVSSKKAGRIHVHVNGGAFSLAMTPVTADGINAIEVKAAGGVWERVGLEAAEAQAFARLRMLVNAVMWRLRQQVGPQGMEALLQGFQGLAVANAAGNAANLAIPVQ